MESIRIIQPSEAVFEAVRQCYAKYPWSIALEDDDLASLVYAMRLLPYRPPLHDVAGAVAALSIDRGCVVEELTWAEVKEVFGLKLVPISSKATVLVSGRVEKVEE